jgi:nitrate reductase gamma subunit
VHLRWELYPVAHERGRAAYGGSHFEEPEHWAAPRQVDHAGEARAMAREILLLEGVRLHNRQLWRFSWPFHVGVYLLVLWLGLLLLAGVVGPAARQSLLLVWAIDLVGFAALGLGLWGGLGLLYHRLSDPSLRAYNAPADVMNLLIWLVYLGWTLGVHALDGGFASLADLAASLLRFEAASLSPALTAEVVFGALLLAYLPLSRMFHFVAKYFLYHDVRWNDAPNPRGGVLEGRLARAMDFGVAWQGPHVDGTRSWGETARKRQP